MGSKIHKSAHFYRKIEKSATFAKLVIENEFFNFFYCLLLLDFFTEMQ